MKSQTLQFSNFIETLYSLPLEDKVEIKSLLDHNIAESRRIEISNNYKNALEEYKSGSMKFSNEISELKRIL